MRYKVLAAAWMAVLAACATSNSPAPDLGEDRGDAGETGDSGEIADSGAADTDASNFDFDAQRPLTCGDAGFCETRVPRSDLGVPLSVRGVWAVDSNDVWSVSAEGYVLHYDGTSWTAVHRVNHALSAVWATATDAWAGGEGGILLHGSAGGVWSRVETGHVTTIRAIYGASGSDVWFTSRGASVDHWDGTALTNRPIDVSGLQITTVFGRAGAGTFAAGYVKGPPPPGKGKRLVSNTPYVFELTPTAISTFNTSLQDQEGFVPVSAVVTDAPDEAQRIFMLGYIDLFTELSIRYSQFGSTTTAGLGPIGGVVESSDDRAAAPPILPLWAANWNDIQVPLKANEMSVWDGTSVKIKYIPMGYSFVPGTVYGIHGTSKDTWIVGEGFALKRSIP